MTYQITSKNLAYLWAVNDLIATNGYSPTVREIGDVMRIRSTSTVFDHVQKLIGAKLMNSRTSIPRTLRITSKGAVILEDWKNNGLDSALKRLRGWQDD